MIADQLDHPLRAISAETMVSYVQGQTEATGWGKKLEQLHGERLGCRVPSRMYRRVLQHIRYAHRSIPARPRTFDHRKALFLCWQGRVQLCNGRA